MAVFRVEKNSGYTVMSNHHLRNRTLSLKAKGLLSQMLSLPEDWDYTLQGLARINRESIKDILIDGITGNLSGLFDNVNAKVGEIASDVGSTPQAWNSGIFNMLRSLSETVVLPIAAAILALVMCHELIQMITEKNNM